jgi:hypothetical protein
LTEIDEFQPVIYTTVGLILLKQKMTKNLLRFEGDSLPGTEPEVENDFADFRSGRWPLRHITSGAVMPKSAKRKAKLLVAKL